MIGRLRGVLLEYAVDGTVTVDVAGVGYELLVPKRLRLQEDGEVDLFVHTHVREDSLTLYGFDSRDDRIAFLQLMSVTTVGPRLAMAIVNALPAAALAQALAHEDKGAFKGISGVGKRTVERLILDLKEKLPPLIDMRAAPQPDKTATPEAAPGLRQAAVQALTAMGYRAGEAEAAVKSVLEGEDVDGFAVEQVLRRALGRLSLA